MRSSSVSPSGDEEPPNRKIFIASTALSSGNQHMDKMPSKHKFYEYYTLGCISVRTESLALCVAVQFLLTNGFLIWLSLQGWHPYWRLVLPAVFNAGASLALIYAWWADKTSYSLLFLIINGLSICALALALFALLLIETDPTMLKEFIEYEEQDGNYVYETVKDQDGSEHVHVRQKTIAAAWRHYAKQLELSGWLREAELGLVLMLLLLWIAQGIVCHFYRYAKLRKVERFERAANGCSVSSASRASGTNFRIPVATLRRLQHVQQQQKQMPTVSKY
uniref:Transmembrane protein n=1 Tax=Globodera rostochiensis TaxID=31243 RepID=A0A914I2P1_GLORO